MPHVFRNALPTGASQLADLLLPLKCRPTVELPRFTFILGAMQLSHKTLFKGLEDQILAGDPHIRLEFYHGMKALCHFLFFIVEI